MMTKQYLDSPKLTLLAGNREVVELVADGENSWRCGGIRLSIAVSSEAGLLLLRPFLETDRDLEIDRLEILNVQLPCDGVDFLRFGLNMPGDPVRFGLLKDGRITPPVLDMDRNSGAITENSEWIAVNCNSLLAFKAVSAASTVVIGNGTFHHAEGSITLCQDRRSGGITLKYSFILDHVLLRSNTRRELDRIVVLQGERLNCLLNAYADYTAAQTTPKIPAEIPTGWNDWQFFRNRKTQEDVLASAGVIADLKRRGYPLHFIQVDGGFCLHLSEWGRPNENFSDGIAALSEKIRKQGLKFGLWLAPYIQNRLTSVICEHPEWLLLNADGNPVELARSNVGNSVLIDYSIPAAQEWLRRLIRMFIDEWHVSWIKLDGPNYALYRLGRLRNREMTITGMLAQTFELMREEAGPDVLIEGEGAMGVALGRADLHRVQTDNHPEWYRGNSLGNPHAPAVFGKELIMAFLHRRWWCNHRENVILRNYPTPFYHARSAENLLAEPIFTEAELHTQLAAAVLGSGGLLLTDPMPELLRIPERMRYVSKLLPVWPQAAEIVDAFPANRYPAIYRLPVVTPLGDYTLIGIINWGDETADFELKLADVAGAGEHSPHVCFSFFEQRAQGGFTDTLAVRGVAAHDCRLLAIRQEMDHPQFIASSMHLIQGAVELGALHWDGEAGCLRLVVKHYEQSDEKLFLRTPPGWKIIRIDSNAARYSVDDFDPLFPVIRFAGVSGEQTFFNIFWSEAIC